MANIFMNLQYQMDICYCKNSNLVIAIFELITNTKNHYYELTVS
ncbi:hypothetical protein Leryth_009277, partial [Lithospermum erythrorhizon]